MGSKKEDSPSGEGTIDGSEAITTVEDVSTVLEMRKYDKSALENFLDAVFHAELTPEEHVLTWRTKRTPGFPVDDDTLLGKLHRVSSNMAFYFGTATCTADPEGKLYNRKALFSRLFVVVLDDIGTKIPREDMPKDLEPSYIIETSEGNEQWGFILETPIDNLAQAEVFVSLIYRSGYTDGGGAMPTKLVRLPLGFNMKQGREEMPVKLLSLTDKRFTADELLLALDTGVTWAEIEADPLVIRQTALASTQNAAPWSSMHANSVTLDGIVDPVLDWLYLKEQVLQETDQWVSIICPWHAMHTEEGAISAGYSPLGWGEDVNRKRRGFHCFHNSCSGKHSGDFLEYVAAHGGPEAASMEYVPELLMQYVFDAGGDCAWDVAGSPVPIKINSMKNKFAQPLFVPKFDGIATKTTRVPPTTMWLQNPGRVDIAGAEYNPGSRARLFENEWGERLYNLFRMPTYPPIPVDEAQVQPFYDYIDYLIPDDREYNFFMDWLSCKVKDPTFRGPALYMIAETQGIGRTTLCEAINRLFGSGNLQTVPFERLIKAATYNTFQEALFVAVNETLSVDQYKGGRQVADQLKEIIDTRPQRATINPKYGRQREVTSVASYIFLSNHADGLPLTEGDRRYYAIENAFERALPEFYADFNAYIDGQEWKTHLWNDLLAREVNMEEMLKPPVHSETMLSVIQESKSALDLTISSFIANWPTTMYPAKLIKDIIAMVDSDLYPASDKRAYIVTRCMKSALTAAHRDSAPMKVGGIAYRFWVPKQAGKRRINSDSEGWNQTRNALEKYDPTDMLAKVLLDLDAAAGN